MDLSIKLLIFYTLLLGKCLVSRLNQRKCPFIDLKFTHQVCVSVKREVNGASFSIGGPYPGPTLCRFRSEICLIVQETRLKLENWC